MVETGTGAALLATIPALVLLGYAVVVPYWTYHAVSAPLVSIVPLICAVVEPTEVAVPVTAPGGGGPAVLNLRIRPAAPPLVLSASRR